MEENKQAATEHANANTGFDGFDGISNEGNESDSFKSVDEMPKGDTVDKKEDAFKDFGEEIDTKEDVKETIKKEGSESVKSEEKKEEKTDDDVPELKIEDDVLVNADKKEEVVEQETTWIETAKDLGLDVKEDSFEAFKESIEGKIQFAKEEGKKEAVDISLDKLAPEARNLFEFLNSDPNNKIEDYVKPLERYDNVLAMNDEAIVREDYKLMGWDEDRIDEKIERMKDADEIESKAYELRMTVQNLKNQAQHDILQDAKDRSLQAQQKYNEQSQKEIKMVIDELDKTKTFMGYKIPENAHKHIKQQWESGEVRKAFQSNPQDVVEFMMWKYLGKSALAEISKAEYQKGRDGIQSKLHNIKAVNGSEGSGLSEKRKVTNDKSFDAWDAITEESPGIDSNGF